MKLLLPTTLLSLLSCIVCKGQEADSAIRYYKNTDSFEIKYVYDPFRWMDTMVGRMICDSNGNNCREDTQGYIDNRHYEAIISVYKMNGTEKHLIGRPFVGTYVPVGCFEDVPSEEVKWAFKLQLEIDKKNKQ